jgi:hypothetical protein
MPSGRADLASGFDVDAVVLGLPSCPVFVQTELVGPARQVRVVVLDDVVVPVT